MLNNDSNTYFNENEGVSKHCHFVTQFGLHAQELISKLSKLIFDIVKFYIVSYIAILARNFLKY